MVLFAKTTGKTYLKLIVNWRTVELLLPSLNLKLILFETPLQIKNNLDQKLLAINQLMNKKSKGTEIKN